jgi:CHASE2 domain-containing sensor protein
MNQPDDGGRAAMRAFAVAALALAGLAFSLTPFARFLDDALLDHEWRLLRQFDVRPSADDVIIVGIDPATVSAIAEPPALWHESLGKALGRIAATRPRAIGFDFPLPERSYDSIKPGLDRALFAGLAAAIGNGPFVATLGIDPRTRSAKRIHTPFLALLGEERLGIGLTALDADAVTRRFSLLVPTEDGGFPTLTGRMCRAMKRDCGDGFINYALGPPLRYVPLKTVLDAQDGVLLEKLFRDRIVMIGETQPYGDRIAVPVNLASWEPAARDSPGVVVHAQTLRTALANAAPQEASRPLVVLLLSAAALLFLIRDWRMAAAVVTLAVVATVVTAVVALRGGVFLPIAPILATLILAWVARAASSWRTGRKRTSPAPNIQHSP